DVDDFAADLDALLDETPLVFPAWESLPNEHNVADTVFGGRLQVLSALEAEPRPGIIVTSLPALLQPVPARTQRDQGRRTLKVGEDLDRDGLLHWLVERGFERTSAVEVPGEFAVHGGIVDVYPPDAGDPLRVELFGDEIESIRRFSVETQRTIDILPEVSLTVVSPLSADDALVAAGGGEILLDAVPETSWLMLAEPRDLI